MENPTRKNRKKLAESNLVLLDEKLKENSDDLDAIKSLFAIILEIRNFEISQLVQRNNFFMIFQGVLFAGIVQSAHSKPVVSFLVCVAGFIVSVFQVGMASGAKFWQDYWQGVLQKIEVYMLKGIAADGDRKILFHLFHRDECEYTKIVKNQIGQQSTGFVNSLILKKYSVSRVPIFVAIFLSIVWFLLVLCTLRGYPPLSVPSFIVGF